MEQTKQEEKKPQVVESPEQPKFKETIDADGIRKVLILGNERVGGCPFNCIGCGVHDKAQLVTPEVNATRIAESVADQGAKIAQNQDKYKEVGYHVCVYNEGNVTNTKELSRDNLIAMLKGLDGLNPPPKYISLNSRGAFVDQEILGLVNSLELKSDIHFILGVESLSSARPEIYGKKGIASELDKVFSSLREENIKPDQKTKFGIDAGFVYLPEFYLEEGESRENKKKIMEGFINDVKSFIEKYVGTGVPVRINLHPYYKIPNLPYEDSLSLFREFMNGVAELLKTIKEVNMKVKSEEQKAALFIGVQGGGYGTDEWNQATGQWKPIIDRINALKVSDDTESDKIVGEILSR